LFGLGRGKGRKRGKKREWRCSNPLHEREKREEKGAVKGIENKKTIAYIPPFSNRKKRKRVSPTSIKGNWREKERKEGNRRHPV